MLLSSLPALNRTALIRRSSEAESNPLISCVILFCHSLFILTAVSRLLGKPRSPPNMAVHTKAEVKARTESYERLKARRELCSHVNLNQLRAREDSTYSGVSRKMKHTFESFHRRQMLLSNSAQVVLQSFLITSYKLMPPSSCD